MRVLEGEPFNRINLPFNGTIAVNIYDFMFLDTSDNSVKPFSSMTDQGTLVLNQALGGRQFVGMSGDTRKVTDLAAVPSFPIMTDVVIKDMPCSSATFEVGDLVAPVEDAGGTFLVNQSVVKTTDPSIAIGQVIARKGSAATTVDVRVQSRLFGASIRSGVVPVSFAQSLHATKTAWNILTAEEAMQVVGIDYVPDIAQGGAATATVVKVTGTNAPVAATTPMQTGSFDANATANTNQQATLTATAADLLLAPGDRIGVKFSTAPTVGSGTFTIRLRRL